MSKEVIYHWHVAVEVSVVGSSKHTLFEWEAFDEESMMILIKLLDSLPEYYSIYKVIVDRVILDYCLPFDDNETGS